MGNIVLKMQDYGNDADFEKAVTAASAALPPGMAATPGTQTRTIEGKLVEAHIGIPGDATAQNMLDARNAAVDGNPGVAVALAFPIGGQVDNLDSVTGVIAASGVSTILSVSGLNALVLASATESEIVAAAGADSFGGTGSAHEIKDADVSSSLQNHTVEADYSMRAVDNNLDFIKGHRFASTIKMIDKGFNGDFSSVSRISFFSSDATGVSLTLLHQPARFGNNNWWLRNVRNNADNVDTGIGLFDQFEYNLTMTPDGIVSLTVGAFSIVKNLGFAPLQFQPSMKILMQDRFLVAAAGQQKSMILDNMDFAILS